MQEKIINAADGFSIGQVPEEFKGTSLGELPPVPAPESSPEITEDPEIAGMTIEAIEKGMEAGTMDIETGTNIIRKIKDKQIREKIATMTPIQKADYNIKLLEDKIKEFTKAKIDHQSIAHGYEGHIKNAEGLLKRIKHQRRMMGKDK